MYGQKILIIFIFLFISIRADREKKKTCIHNLVLNRTNLITTHRKQLLVIGITNFNDRSSRSQANRYNDIYRELQRHDIYDSVVRLILINEKDAAEKFPGKLYDKVRIYQDNSKDRIIQKLRNKELTTNNYVFGRCGYLIYSQEGSNANLDDGKNFQALLQVIITAIKNRRRCQGLCS